MEKHVSVLLKEAIFALNIKEEGTYVDMTLGFAGHSKEILKELKTGMLYAFDKDKNAIDYSTKVLSEIGNHFKIFHKGFVEMKDTLEKEGITKIDGCLFDLGISSVEIDDEQRGFSYMKDAKLDMRMNQEQELSAYDIINQYSKEELIHIFREYGEEKHAGKIAKAIVEEREMKPIATTLELVNIISRCYPYRDKRDGHPAKKVFQAVRIAVNNELEEFEKALLDALNLLNKDGIIAVISFHSLEDRICKNIFKRVSEIDPMIKGIPNINQDLLPDYEIITRKPILPSIDEIERNKRAKSAKLRIIKRIK